tara:strand:+ start:1172 stop:2005 length:834 start_codon:yes stop_codon:yes gene_type:complete
VAEGILDTEVARKASEQLGDLEYSLPFMQQLENNPLFKVGFDPKHVYYQREKRKKDIGTNIPGVYYPYGISEKELQRGIEKALASKNETHKELISERLRELQKNIGELGEGPYTFSDPDEQRTDEFVFMEEQGKEHLRKQNIITTVHEFVHRAIHTNYDLEKFLQANDWPSEHGLIMYMIADQFPELREHSYKRAKDQYKVDLTDKRTEQKYANLYTKMQKISQNILDKRLEEGRAKEPVVPIKVEEPDKSFFQKLREKIGFNEGGMVDINHLTRRL